MESVAKAPKIQNRHAEWMRDLLEMIHMQYQKNQFINVREVAFWKKVYESNKEINK